jgi:predicted P-loop ATPase
MLIELAEIVALIRSDLEELKAFLTNDKDTFRVAYDKHTHDFKRTVTFIGTTNDYNWLNDPTGGRRFWPVKVGDIELKALERDRDQLFAEAVVSFKRRRKWWPSRRVEARLFAPQQELRQELLGPFDEKVAEVLKGMDEPTLREIGDKLGATSVQDWTQLQSRLAASMRRLKWIPLQTTIDGEKKRFWKRGPDAEPKGNNANSSENKYRDNDEIPF